jgi:hypothetical protein
MAGSDRDRQPVHDHAQAADQAQLAELRHALESIEALAAGRRAGAMGEILAIATHALRHTELT